MFLLFVLMKWMKLMLLLVRVLVCFSVYCMNFCLDSCLVLSGNLSRVCECLIWWVSWCFVLWCCVMFLIMIEKELIVLFVLWMLCVEIYVWMMLLLGWRKCFFSLQFLVWFLIIVLNNVLLFEMLFGWVSLVQVLLVSFLVEQFRILYRVGLILIYCLLIFDWVMLSMVWLKMV